jgi:hypothetical protein
MAFKTATIRPLDGGQLMTRLEAAPIPIEHYRIKRNWRRDKGRERRREGHVKFQPAEGDLGSQPWPNQINGQEITFVKSFTNAAGRLALIAASQAKIYRFIALDDLDVYYEAVPDWRLSYGDSPLDYPTYYREIPSDILTIPGHTVSDEDPLNYPAYEGDEGGSWMEIGTGYSEDGHRWEGVEVGGMLIMNNGYDLPLSLTVNELEAKPLFELRDQGIAYVDTIASFNGMLICLGIAEIKAEYLDAVRLASDYGPQVVPETLNRYQYRMINSPIGYPTKFGPNVLGTMEDGSASVQLDYPANFLTPGDEIIVTGAGTLGGNLTATIINMSTDKRTLHLTAPAETAVVDGAVFGTDTLSYGPTPGFYDLEDDGSAILRAVELSERLVIMKSNGIAQATYTGNSANPFDVRMTYTDSEGARSLYYRWTIWVDRGGYIGYVGRYNVFRYDLTGERPELHPVIDLSSDILFNAAETATEDEIFSAVNTVSDEVWLCFPSAGTDQGLCYSMSEPSCSTIDFRISAADTVMKPIEGNIRGAAEEWFTMAVPNAPPSDDGDDLGGTLRFIFTYNNQPYSIGNGGFIPLELEPDEVSGQLENKSGQTVNIISISRDPLYSQGFLFSGGLGASIPSPGLSSTLTIEASVTTELSRFIIEYDVGGPSKKFYVLFGGPGSTLMRYAKSNLPEFSGARALFTRDGSEYDSILKGGFTDFGYEFYEKMLRGYVLRVSALSRDVDSEIQLFDADRASDLETLILTKVVRASTIHTLFLAHNITDQVRVTGPTDFEIFARSFDIDVAETQGINKV